MLRHSKTGASATSVREGACLTRPRRRRAVSPISFFEIGLKVRLGKWPEMEALVDRLRAFLDERGGSVASLDLVVCTSAGCIGVAAPRPLRSAACGDRVPLQPAHRLR